MHETSDARHEAIRAATYRRHLIARGQASIAVTPPVEMRVRLAAVAAVLAAVVAATLL